MRPAVMAHVDKLGGTLHTPESCFYNCLRGPHKGDYRAVGGLAGVDIEELYPPCFGYGFDDAVDFLLVAPFAEIGHTFNQSFHHGIMCWFIFVFKEFSFLQK